MREPHEYQPYPNRRGCVKCPYPQSHGIHHSTTEPIVDSAQQTSGPEKMIAGAVVGGGAQHIGLTVEEDSSSETEKNVGETIWPTSPESTRAVLSRLLPTLKTGTPEHEAVRLSMQYIIAKDLPPIA